MYCVWSRSARKFLILTVLMAAILSLGFAGEVRAANFTISGVLQQTDPQDNKYHAQYMVVTSEGKKFYFQLKSNPYLEWVGKQVYFHVGGSVNNYAVYTSGLGVRNNTIPKTGAEMLHLAILAAVSSLGITIYRRKSERWMQESIWVKKKQ